MNERALKHLFDDLARSLDRLGEALTVGAEEPLAIDGTVQRFEFTFELFWKVVRRLLALQGVDANSPKAVLQKAYRLGWLDDEQEWLDVLKDRNLTSHTYREALALEIYSRIPAHHAAMRTAFDRLRDQLPS
jgi:nucleotidyltransferase substrate binding protein (TIGR01987 family)